MNIFKQYWLFFVISLVVIVPGMISLAVNKVKPSIDFTGGSLLEVALRSKTENQTVTVQQVEESASQVKQFESIVTSGPDVFLLKGKSMPNSDKDFLLDQFRKDFNQVQEIRFETVGPTLGRELLIRTLIAVLIVAIVITLYVMKQFSEARFGVSAVVAMFHDTLVLFGAFSLLGWKFGVEVDVLFVTAVLTTLSFSIHDTIVVYDRIRELRKTHPGQSVKSLANLAVVQTLSRSVNNSFTIIIMLITLALLGGETIRWFVVALLIGAVTGTYSSTFTAIPLLLLSEDLQKWRKGREKKK